MIEGTTVIIGTRLSILDRSPAGPVSIPLGALCRHVSILGATGFGKSACAKVPAAELGDAGVPTLIFDRTGEYVESLGKKAYAKVATPSEGTRIAPFARDSRHLQEQVEDWISLLNHFCRVSFGGELSPL